MRCVIREAATSTPKHPRYLWIVWDRGKEKARGFADTEEEARAHGEQVIRRLQPGHWFEENPWAP